MKWLLDKENKIPQFLCLVLILATIGCMTTDFFIHNSNLQTERVMLTPERMEEGANGTRTVYIDLEDISEINNTLLFYTNHQIINGYIDGELVYSVQKSASPFGRTTGAVWNFLELPADAKELVLHFSPVYSNVPVVALDFQLGNGVQMYRDLICRSLMDLLVSLAIFIIGIALLLYWFAVLRKTNSQRAVLYLGSFATIFGFWTVGENQIAHVLMSNRPLASYLAFTCLMTMALPFVMFIREFLNTKDKWLHKIIIIYVVTSTVVCQTLHLTGVLGVKQTVNLTLGSIGMTLAYLLYAIIMELKEGADRRKAYVNIIGIIVLIIATFLDTSSYFSDHLDEQQTGNVGFLIYAIILGSETARHAQEQMRERQKLEIYREMAEKDMLTNCYNRNAYSEDMGKITDPEGYQILLFDLNNLKKRNDTMGHIAGDKYIVDSANIIYDIFGELGKVYRVGGDEFCVMTRNIPIEVINRDKSRLMDAINQRRTQEEDPDFGIACGYAKYDSSVDKSIEDMRNRADVEMYYNKEELKK